MEKRIDYLVNYFKQLFDKYNDGISPEVENEIISTIEFNKKNYNLENEDIIEVLSKNNGFDQSGELTIAVKSIINNHFPFKNSKSINKEINDKDYNFELNFNKSGERIFENEFVNPIYEYEDIQAIKDILAKENIKHVVLNPFGEFAGIDIGDTPDSKEWVNYYKSDFTPDFLKRFIIVDISKLEDDDFVRMPFNDIAQLENVLKDYAIVDNGQDQEGIETEKSLIDENDLRQKGLTDFQIAIIEDAAENGIDLLGYTDFEAHQLIQIYFGLENKVDVSKYADTTIDSKEMKKIRKKLEYQNHLDMREEILWEGFEQANVIEFGDVAAIDRSKLKDKEDRSIDKGMER